MAKVLVVDHERRIRKWLTDSLGKAGYEVVEAENGPTALEMASRQQIDFILLDDALPKMDGWQVLTKLKEDSQMQRIPVVILTAFPSFEIEATGIRLGAAHVLSKPCRTESLETTVRVALREAERSGGDVRPANVEPEDDLPLAKGNAAGTSEFINTGSKLVALDKLLKGGLRTGSLTLIEGASGAGKSVICQHLYYGSITSGVGAAYFSTQYTAARLAKQMQSIGLNVLDHIRQDSLCVYPLQERPTGDDADSLLTELASEIQGVPPECGFIIVDGITNLAQISQDRAVMGFFTSCQRQCEEGKTIILVARPSAFDQSLLSRLHELCNTHMNLFMETVRNRMVTTLEATKINNAESRSDNRLSFQVEAELGVNLIPVGRVRV